MKKRKILNLNSSTSIPKSKDNKLSKNMKYSENLAKEPMELSGWESTNKLGRKLPSNTIKRRI